MERVLGLTSLEAQKLLEQFGPNKIVDRPRQTRWQIFLSQFTNILIVLLTAAAIASLFLGDLLDGVFILLIVILNGFLGFIQEYKAEKAITALSKMTVSSVRVIRDGLEQKVESHFLVPGDVVILQEGDQIPADGQLLESLHLEANEASLTGESMPIEKNPQDESKKQIFLGTTVAKGRGKAQVTLTGMQTRFGQIAVSLSQIKEEKTPLQKKLSTLGKQLGILALGASSTVFVIGLFSKYSVIEMVLTSVSLAVAAVPEGLPAVITIALAVGMQRMASKRAILRRLASIETLGATTIIATDKTGTLTKNEMRVVKVWGDLDKILTAGVVCNNASLVFNHDSQKYDVLGDTTEGALLLLAAEKGLMLEQVKAKGTLLEEFSFDPTLKLMSVVWEENRQKIVYTKGAPESILEKSNLNQKEKQNIETAFQEYAKEGLRVIALAYKNTERMPETRQDAEKDLVFAGFVGIADPAREEVKEAISQAKKAGIQTMMITGDNELTANSIAEKIGLIQKDEEILTGKQFEQLSDDEAMERLSRVRIFARTTPDHKLRIVRLLQKMGQVVAVTGDGVNDVLALKQADVGVAMGITGTDVAKLAADMIITDDNYATLVTAVEEGRTIFNNIKSAIKYLVGCNIGEVLAVVIAMLLGWPLILTPLQLLYVNLITDGLPAIVLAVTPKDEDVMKLKPRVSKNIFDRLDGIWFLEISILTTIATLAAFYIGMQSNNLILAQTLTFTTIILVQHFILLDVRAKNNSFWQKKIFCDKFFLLAFSAPLVLQLFLIYIPYLSSIFKITAVSLTHLLLIIALSAILLVSSEIRKTVLRSRKTFPC